MKIALVEAKPSKSDFNKLFDNAFEFTRYSLSSNPTLKKILKADVDIEINIDDYKYIILVGAEPLKYFVGSGKSVTDYSGKLINDKFIACINPAMIRFKPEVERLWEASKNDIILRCTDKLINIQEDATIFGINAKEEAKSFILDAINHENKYVALDSETSALYPRKGRVLGISLSYAKNIGAYIDADCLDEELSELLQKLWNKKTVILHNAKFDLAFFKYHFGWVFPNIEDTMLLHYCLEENPGTHGLKQLALKYTSYGDYEEELYTWIDEYRKQHKILKEDFSWEFIPFEIMVKYAAYDAITTFLIFLKLKAAVVKNEKLNSVYNNILLPALRFTLKMEDNGVPLDRQRLDVAKKVLEFQVQEATNMLNSDPIVKSFIERNGEFNPRSPQQLRKLLFDDLGLSSSGKLTATKALSTDAEVLEELSEQSIVPGLILEVRKAGKLLNTYINKIIPQLDRDGRLRTNFNLHGTVAGRLSSSGTLNMQQLPRDNPAVKGCIMARPGWKIVSMDLKTAEVYVAAVLSKDKALMDVFTSGGDFHSTIAKKVFNLPCAVEEVKDKYPLLRQAAKAITFGIMYQAGPEKVASEISKSTAEHCSVETAAGYIRDYFDTFKKLKSWIETNKALISKNGYCYSHFGRKRRLPNVFSSDRAILGHAVRSGINFLVQSPASDVNLLAAVEMQQFIDDQNMKAKIFALVHDSIVAEVPDEELEIYKEALSRFVKTDRGISIPGCPIGLDIEVGQDYSFGKFDKFKETEWKEIL